MKKPYWYSAVSYSLLGYGAQLGLAFLIFMVLVRLLGEHEFGVWVLYMTLISFTEAARTGLVQNGLIKYYKEEREEKGRIMTAAFVLNTITGLGLALLLVSISPLLSRFWAAGELPQLLWWYAPYVLIFGSARFLEYSHMANDDFKGIFFSKAAYGLLLLIFIFLYWKLSPSFSLTRLPLLQCLSAIPSLGILLFYRREYLSWSVLDFRWMRRLFHFGKFVLGTNFGSMLFNRMDLMMVGAFLNPAAVAMYNIASRISTYMEAPMTGIAQVIYPKMAGAGSKSNGEAITPLYEKSVAALLSVMAPLSVGVLFFAHPIVLAIAGERYIGAVPVLYILVTAIFLKPWGRLSGIALDAIGKPRINFLLMTGSVLVNLGMNLLLIPSFGISGAAVATLIASWLTVIAGQLFVQRMIPFSHRRIFREIIRFYQQSAASVKAKLNHYGIHVW